MEGHPSLRHPNPSHSSHRQGQPGVDESMFDLSSRPQRSAPSHGKYATSQQSQQLRYVPKQCPVENCVPLVSEASTQIHPTIPASGPRRKMRLVEDSEQPSIPSSLSAVEGRGVDRPSAANLFESSRKEKNSDDVQGKGSKPHLTHPRFHKERIHEPIRLDGRDQPVQSIGQQPNTKNTSNAVAPGKGLKAWKEKGKKELTGIHYVAQNGHLHSSSSSTDRSASYKKYSRKLQKGKDNSTINLSQSLTIELSGSELAVNMIEEIQNNSYECLICFRPINRKRKIWMCRCCFHIFDHECIDVWFVQQFTSTIETKEQRREDQRELERYARGVPLSQYTDRNPSPDSLSSSSSSSSKHQIMQKYQLQQQGYSWSCPSCRSEHNGRPKPSCFCGKFSDLPSSPLLLAHSCGETCGRERGFGCPHVCTSPCHPGPCPPCAALGPIRECYCGKSQYVLRCGQDDRGAPGRTCSQECGKLLSCGRHQCQKVCHLGSCGSCPRMQTQFCFCGKSSRLALCGEGNPHPHSPSSGPSLLDFLSKQCKQKEKKTENSPILLLPLQDSEAGGKDCKEEGNQKDKSKEEVNQSKKMKANNKDSSNDNENENDNGNDSSSDNDNDNDNNGENEGAIDPAIKDWGFFSCESPCERSLDCNLHFCTRRCHPLWNFFSIAIESSHDYTDKVFLVLDDNTMAASRALVSSARVDDERDQKVAIQWQRNCIECHLQPEKVKFCPCGKTPIKEGARKLCTDPIVVCDQICNRPFASCSHVCPVRCHTGECPPCSIIIHPDCRCGSSKLSMVCQDALIRPEVLLCQKVCKETLGCRKHKCGQICCNLTAKQHKKCPQTCGKLLSCKKHYCEKNCHANRCANCTFMSFDELACNCGAKVLFPPVSCSTSLPMCSGKCPIPRECGHTGNHACHWDQDCPRCTSLIVRPCASHRTLLSNVLCCQADAMCGRVCGRIMDCMEHTCHRSCHSGSCFTHPLGVKELPEGSCGIRCGRTRIFCQHSCKSFCHPTKNNCPNQPCTEKLTLTCACGLRKEDGVCSRGGPEELFEAWISDALNNRIPDSKQKLESLRKPRLLPCNFACTAHQRRQQIAFAFGKSLPPSIDASSSSNARSASSIYVSDESRVPFSQFLIEVAQATPLIISRLEQIFREFLESDQKRYSFPSANSVNRRIVHELAAAYHFHTEGLDREPFRNVTISKDLDSIAPQVLLSEYVHVMRSTAKILSPSPSSSSSSSSSSSTSFSTGKTTKSAGQVGGEIDTSFDHNHVLHLYDLNAEIKTRDILKIFHPIEGRFKLRWLDDCNALLLLQDRADLMTALYLLNPSLPFQARSLSDSWDGLDNVSISSRAQLSPNVIQETSVSSSIEKEGNVLARFPDLQMQQRAEEANENVPESWTELIDAREENQ